MHAIRLHDFGPAENLRYEALPDPEPGPGQIGLAVEAAGVHVIDTHLRAGVAGGPFPLPELPQIPGREVAGVVDRLGPDVDAAWLGRRVVGHLGPVSGGYASRAVIPVTSVHEIPEGASAVEAVAMIGTGRTTMGILHQAALRPDDVLLVLAAAGGIGSLLVQHGRGHTVIGAAGGTEKVALVGELGATVAVDYEQPGWVEAVEAALGPRPATVLFDAVGGPHSAEALQLLADGGRRLVYGGPAGDPAELSAADEARGVTSRVVLGPVLLDLSGGIRTLETRALEALAEGLLTPAVTTFPLADAAAAHRALETRATTGKVVLIP